MYVQRKRTGTGKNEGGWLVEVVSGCQGVAVWVRGPWQDRTSGEPGDGIGGVDDRAIPAAAPAVRSSRVPLLCLCHYCAVVETTSSTRVSSIVIRARISRQPVGLPCFYVILLLGTHSLRTDCMRCVHEDTSYNSVIEFCCDPPRLEPGTSPSPCTIECLGTNRASVRSCVHYVL
jgi:hypothetical protein